MKDWFTWKGKRCTEYGIRVVRQPDIVRPQERITFTTVPGRSGSLTTLEGDDVYDDILLTVECVIRDLNRLDEIIKYLKGYDKVTFANRQGGFYHAHIVNQISFEQVLRGNPHRRFVISFRCQPFFYLTGVPKITISASGTTVENPGTMFSEPVIQVTLTGDAQVTIGSSYIELQGVTGQVTIDTPLKEVYKNYSSLSNHMTGEFPVLHSGQNLISWTGGVTQIVITPNWRVL